MYETDLDAYPSPLKTSIMIEDALFNLNEENYNDALNKLSKYMDRRKSYIFQCFGIACLTRRFKWSLYLNLFNDLSYGRLLLSYKGFNHYLTAAKAVHGSLIMPTWTKKEFEIVFPHDKFAVAISQGNLSRVKEMVAQGDVDLKNKVSVADMSYDPENYEEITYLDLAAYCGDLEIFKFLLSSGMNINNKTCRNAARGGNIEILQILLDNKQDLSQDIAEAVKSHRPEAVQFLLKNVDGEIPEVSLAFAFTNTRFAYYTLKNNHATNEEFAMGAAGTENIDALIFALERVPADCEYHGRTLLVESLRKRSFSAIKHLIKAGANLTIFDDVGVAAFHYLATSPCHDVLRNILRSSKVDPNFRTQTGETALHLAASQGCVSAIADLCDNGADINAQDSKGRTALMLAIIAGRPEPVKELVDRKADQSIKDNEGKTANNYVIHQDVRNVLLGLWHPKKHRGH